MNTANTLLREDTNVIEFMRILKAAKMQEPLTEFTLLISYIDTMEKQFAIMRGELAAIKGKLNEEKPSPLKSAYMGMVKGFEAEMSKTKETLSKAKANLVESVKTAVADFKENGTLALDKAMSFIGVKKALVSLRESLGKLISSAEGNIRRIDDAGKEFHGAAAHMRNVGRALSGKEKLDAAPNGRLNKALGMPFRAIKDTLTGIEKLTGKAIGSLGRLERLAEKAHESKPKNPVRQSVEKIKGDAPGMPDKRGAKNHER